MPTRETFSPVRPRVRYGIVFFVWAPSVCWPRRALITAAAANSRNFRLVDIVPALLWDRCVPPLRALAFCSAERQFANPFPGCCEDCVAQCRDERRDAGLSDTCWWSVAINDVDVGLI